jgi:Ca-activated chloride channel family protein
LRFYKQGLYEQALEQYQSVKDKELDFNRLYNMGNTYAKLQKIDEAIDSYKEALKVKQDEDALFNLAMLKRQKAKQKKNEQTKKGKDKKQQKDKEQKKQDSKKNGKKRKDQDKKNAKQGKNKDKKNAKQGKNKDKKNAKQGKNKDKKDGKKEQQQQKKKLDAIKQRRWEKSLNKNLRTLLIPLNQQNNKNNDDNKKNLW